MARVPRTNLALAGSQKGSEVVGELTADLADVRWTVHVANRKAAWYQWTMALDIPEAAGSKIPRRNAPVTGEQGNHGEDVKECYYYLDSTPTHSYMKCLYKYPQAEFPYKQLLEANAGRPRQEPEF